MTVLLSRPELGISPKSWGLHSTHEVNNQWRPPTPDPRVIAVSAIEMDPRPRILNVDIGARQGLLLTHSPTDVYRYLSPGHLQLPCLSCRRGPISTHHSHEPNPNCTAVTLVARPARPRYHFLPIDRRLLCCARQCWPLTAPQTHPKSGLRAIRKGAKSLPSSGWGRSENAIVHALAHLNTAPSLHLGLRPNLAPNTPIHLVVVLLLLTQHWRNSFPETETVCGNSHDHDIELGKANHSTHGDLEFGSLDASLRNRPPIPPPATRPQCSRDATDYKTTTGPTTVYTTCQHGLR